MSTSLCYGRSVLSGISIRFPDGWCIDSSITIGYEEEFLVRLTVTAFSTLIVV